MTPETNSQDAEVRALVVYLPRAGELYDLDATAMLAGVTRRDVLMYCRCGLLNPLVEVPYGAMMFGPEAIHIVRRIERVRVARGLERAWVAAMFEVLDELELLRAEWRERQSA
jgi:hypothetical protein